MSSHSLAAGRVAAAGLTEDGLTVTVLLQEAHKRCENLDVILLWHGLSEQVLRSPTRTYGGAVGMSAAVVAIQILVHLHHKSVYSTAGRAWERVSYHRKSTC